MPAIDPTMILDMALQLAEGEDGVSEEAQDQIDTLLELIDDPGAIDDNPEMAALIERYANPESAALSLEPDRSAVESASAAVDAIIDTGSSAGALIADEIRTKVRALAAKKYPPRP